MEKHFTESMRALVLWGALQVDLADKAETEEERQLADDLVSLLTPVIKGYGTYMGYQIATESQQVYGGHGYITEWGMEQFVRDARIAMIYEGTNGIQAMDLVGRKLAQNGGRAVQALFGVIAQEIEEAKGHAQLTDPLLKRSKKPMANCRKLPCGSCKMRWPTQTMLVLVPIIICISWA